MAKSTHTGCTHCGCEDSETVFDRVPYGMGEVDYPGGGICTDCHAEWEETEWCNECEVTLSVCTCHRCSDCGELNEDCNCIIELVGTARKFTVAAKWLRNVLKVDDEDAFDTLVSQMSKNRADELYNFATEEGTTAA